MTPAERPTPEEAMEWLLAPLCCEKCRVVNGYRSGAPSLALHGAGQRCPACASLLYRAIASRLEAQREKSGGSVQGKWASASRPSPAKASAGISDEASNAPVSPAQREDATPTPERDVKLGEFCECYKRFGGNCPCSRWTPGAAPPSAPSPEVEYEESIEEGWHDWSQDQADVKRGAALSGAPRGEPIQDKGISRALADYGDLTGNESSGEWSRVVGALNAAIKSWAGASRALTPEQVERVARETLRQIWGYEFGPAGVKAVVARVRASLCGEPGENTP